MAPDPPTGLTAQVGDAPVIAVLAWVPPAADVSTYRVYVALAPDGRYTLAGTVSTPGFSYTRGLGGISYYFRVTSVNAADEESDFVQVGPVRASWAESPHVPANDASPTCGKCHSVHTASSGMIFRAELATDAPFATGACLGCHSGGVASAANISSGTFDSFLLQSGHSLETSPSLVRSCSSCHETHAVAATSPMLPGRSVNGATVSGTGPAWCEACHDSKNSWFLGVYPPADRPDRDAFGYPVAGTWPGPGTYNGGSNAHRLIPETTQTADAGVKVRRSAGDCLYCHRAHGSTSRYDSLAEAFAPSTAATLVSDQASGTYAALCFTCHGGSVPSGFMSAPTNIKQSVTSDTVSAGHRVVTPGGDLPVGSPLPCYECHNPHGSTRGNASMISDERGKSLETSTASGVRHFCFTCHTTSDTGAGWDSSGSGSGAYAAVDSAKVVGLPRTGGWLKLRQRAGHAVDDKDSCYDCHGSDYGSGGYNVHNVGPASFDVTPPTTISDVKMAYTTLATIQLTALDDAGGSGVASTHYSLDGGPEVTGTTVTVYAAGSHTLQFWSVDVAGNVETPSAPVNFTIIDVTAPVTTSDAVVSYSTTATITLAATDTSGGSGVAYTHFSLDAGLETSGTTVTSSVVGPHTLEFWSADLAGNVETPHKSWTFDIQN